MTNNAKRSDLAVTAVPAGITGLNFVTAGYGPLNWSRSNLRADHLLLRISASSLHALAAAATTASVAMAPSASPFSKSPSVCALVGPKGRGLAVGLNEFAGYFARGVTAFLPGCLASRYGLRPVPIYLGVFYAAAASCFRSSSSGTPASTSGSIGEIAREFGIRRAGRLPSVAPSVPFPLRDPASIGDPVAGMQHHPVPRSETGENLRHPVVPVADLDRDGFGKAVVAGKNGPLVAFPE